MAVGICRTRQTGFAAVAAIFLVVILAALGGFMLTFSNTQQLTAVQDLQGTRAFWAARAGLEWGVAKAVGATPVCAASTTLSTSFDGGFSVTVVCTATTYTDGAVTAIYTITATANPTGSVVGSIGYIERSMTATVELPVP
jgi:MSHA biogenesis protein MshP